MHQLHDTEPGDSSSGSDADGEPSGSDADSDSAAGGQEAAPLLAPTTSKGPVAESHLRPAKPAKPAKPSPAHAATRSAKEEDAGPRLAWGVARRSVSGSVAVTVLLYVTTSPVSTLIPLRWLAKRQDPARLVSLSLSSPSRPTHADVG